MSLPISARFAISKSIKPETLSTGILIVIGIILGIGSAYLLVKGQWEMALVLSFALPVGIFIYKYPLISITIWLFIDPFLMDTPSVAARIVYWIIHRALPPAAVGLLLILSILGIRKLPKLTLVEVMMAGYIILSLFSIALLNPTPLATDYILYDRVFSPMCLYFIVRLYQPNEKDLKGLIPAVFFVCLTQEVIGILSWVKPEILPSQWTQLAGVRTTGSLISYSVYTSTLVFSGLYLLHAALNRKPGIVRAVYIIVFFLAIYCDFISFSRGSWLAGIIVLLGLIYLYPKFILRWILLIIPAAIILIGIVFSNQLDFVIERLSSADSRESALSRLPVAYAAIQMFEIKPVLGWGYGNFEIYQHQFQGRVADLVNPYEDNPSHNLYLGILAEQGILGLVLFLSPVFWWLIKTIETIPKMPAQGFWSRKLVILLWLVIIDHIIINNFSHMTYPFGLGMWWLTLGMIANIVTSYD